MTDFEDCCLHMSFHLWRKQLHHSSLFDWTLFSMFSRLWQCNYNSLTSILFDSRVWKKDINFIDLKNISKRWNSGNFSISRLRSHLKCSAHTDPHGPGSTRGQEGSGGVSLAAATTQGAREHQTTSERGVHSPHTRDREARAWAGLGTPEDRTRVWGHVEDRAEVLWIRQVRRQGTAVQCLRPRIIALRSRPPGGDVLDGRRAVCHASSSSWPAACLSLPEEPAQTPSLREGFSRKLACIWPAYLFCLLTWLHPLCVT